jgi:hypothetical protein
LPGRKTYPAEQHAGEHFRAILRDKRSDADLDALQRRIDALKKERETPKPVVVDHHSQASVAWRMVTELVAGILVASAWGTGLDWAFGTSIGHENAPQRVALRDRFCARQSSWQEGGLNPLHITHFVRFGTLAPPLIGELIFNHLVTVCAPGPCTHMADHCPKPLAALARPHAPPHCRDVSEDDMAVT